MKKLSALLLLAISSSSALAETGLTIGLGYQTSEIANNFDLNGDPAGLAINVQYAIPGVDGLFVALDITDQEDTSDLGPVDELTSMHERTELSAGYVFNLDNNTSITANLSFSDTEWEWEDGIANNFNRIEGDDSGISVAVGIDKNLGNGVSIGTAFSLGFETGIEAYTAIEVIDNLDIILSYYKNSYELEWEEFDETGSTGTGSSFGDGDTQFDTTGIRISASYSF